MAQSLIRQVLVAGLSPVDTQALARAQTLASATPDKGRLEGLKQGLAAAQSNAKEKQEAQAAAR